MSNSNILISRKKLELLEKSNEALEKDNERLSGKVKLVCESSSRILKRMDAFEEFWKKPWYKRVYLAFWGNVTEPL